MQIITNHQERLIIDAYELTEKERSEFDYIDWDGVESGTESASFVRYKGRLYDLGEFMPSPVEGWHGYSGDTFFSGTLIRFSDDHDHVVMGRYFT